MFDRDKFKRLVHFVIAQAGNKPGFGAVKLNKVLWFAEARQYMLTGHPIAGAEYIREEFGPVPREINAVRRELEAEGKIKTSAPKAAYEGWRFRSLQSPNLTGFSQDEIKLVNWWIGYVADEHTAQSISEESHDYAWDIAKLREPLPFHAFFASRLRTPNDGELDWARQAAGRAGLV